LDSVLAHLLLSFGSVCLHFLGSRWLRSPSEPSPLLSRVLITGTSLHPLPPSICCLLIATVVLNFQSDNSRFPDIPALVPVLAPSLLALPSTSQRVLLSFAEV
jgi:hypothetical protein